LSAPATYRSGAPRDQQPAVARWYAHLRGLATVIHETSGLDHWGTSMQRGGERNIIDCLFLFLALSLHGKGREHNAPIMFPPFSLSPIGFGVVESMGIFLPSSKI
jgi:hypothetical protein